MKYVSKQMYITCTYLGKQMYSEKLFYRDRCIKYIIKYDVYKGAIAVKKFNWFCIATI